MIRRQLAAVVVAVGTTWAMAYAEGTPRIKFNKTEYDFGTTSMVQSVTGTFTFENVGTAELKVNKPAPTCGCTVAGVKPDTLKPGEKGELTFTVNVGNVRGLAQKFINVPSNDPSNATVRLTIKVNVKQLVDLTPAQVSLGDFHQGAVTNVTVRVTRTDGKKLVITNVQASNKLVRARVEPAEPAAANAARVVIQAESEGVPRRFNETVQVFLDGSPTPSLTIPVYGRVVGDVMVTPERLFWGVNSVQRLPAQQMAGLLVRKLTVAGTKEGQLLQLHNPTTTLPGVSLEVVPVQDGKVYSLVAKLAEAPKQSTNGTITVETNLASQPTVVVPVSINVYAR